MVVAYTPSTDTWSQHAGDNVTALRAALSWTAPTLDTALPALIGFTDGKTINLEGWALQDGEIGVRGKLVRKGSKTKRGAGTVLGAAAGVIWRRNAWIR